MPINYQPGSYTQSRSKAFRGESPRPGGLPLNATIIEHRALHDELAVLRIRLNGWELEPFRAGQYIDIAMQPQSSVHQPISLTNGAWSVGDLLRRSYSLASSPDRLDEIEILLNLVSKGEFTPILWRLEAGDRIHVSPRVRGRFTLDGVPDGRHLVFIATGTGLAPYVSMLRAARGQHPAWASVTLLHSVRDVGDLAYRDELEAMAADPEMRLTYLPTVTRAPRGSWQGAQERIPALIEPERYAYLTGGRSIHADDSHVFLCGNPEMIKTLRVRFEEDGFTVHRPSAPGNLHFESYW